MLVFLASMQVLKAMERALTAQWAKSSGSIASPNVCVVLLDVCLAQLEPCNAPYVLLASLLLVLVSILVKIATWDTTLLKLVLHDVSRVRLADLHLQ